MKKKNVTIQQFILYVFAAILLMTGNALLLTSCRETIIDDELIKPGPGGVGGRDGNLNFAINYGTYGAGYDEHTTLQAANLEPETVVMPLQDGLTLFATIQPATQTTVETRSTVALRKFDNNTKICIVAYKQTGPGAETYHQHVNYYVDIVGTDTTLVRESGDAPFSLAYETYRFVAYSYNTTTTPPAPSTGISGLVPDVDLIWGETPSPVIYNGSGTTNVAINMQHLFSKVNLSATSGTTKTISAITDVAMSGYEVNMAVDSGKPTPAGPATPLPFINPAPALPASDVSWEPRIVYTAAENPTMVHINTLSIDSASVTYAFNDLTATFSKQLQRGYVYDLKLNITNVNGLSDDEPPIGFIPYVGAFWKANQRGERLIRIARPTIDPATGNPLLPVQQAAADGAWAATVITGTGANWIALDALPSDDTGLGWLTGNDSGVDDMMTDGSHYVSGGATRVSGTLDASNPYIYFRIGLSNTIGATDHRYGVVLLTYGNNRYRQRIWIRQGDEPDYLMRPVDAMTTGNMITPPGPGARPDAMMFSPYNLTAATLNQAVSVYGRTGQSDPPAIFTDYPSQAGAYFQWANNGSKTRYAWDPYSSGTMSGWDTDVPSTYWTDATGLVDIHETCPPNYRRPNDGITNAANSDGYVSGSEIRQSLFQRPQIYPNASPGNSVYGYYADGFFDRRQIVNAPSLNGGRLSTVSANGSSIGYIGRLYFNPETKASVFFPAAGMRFGNTNGGDIYNAGGGGSYWTSSSGLSGGFLNSWCLANGTSTTQAALSTRTNGFSIRCIWEECVAVTAVTVSPASGSTDLVGTVTLTASVAPTGATNVMYRWERSLDGNTWYVVPDEIAATLNAPAVIVGNTYYRVTASNACSSAVSNTATISGSGQEPIRTIAMYVGAFWRNSQYGERLIRITRPTTAPVDAYDGSWTATVIAGADWIRLDREPSTDTQLGWLTGNDSGVDNMMTNDAAHRLPGAASTTVSGTLRPSASPGYVAGDETIYFRIGLTGANPGSTPRYGMVLLTYNNIRYSQRIFIRQGEADDYLMRPQDPGAGQGYPWGATDPRPQAQRFSPFNLTAATLNATVGINGTGTNPGIFTDYPSQAGAFFQWANSGTRTRYAWDAFNTNAQDTWNNTIPNSYWTDASNLAATHETCPAGYRRPSDGVTNGPNNTAAIVGSETRQSLWLNPPYGQILWAEHVPGEFVSNMTWGYYADGFFDRRLIVSPPAGFTPLPSVFIPATSVSIGNRDIAHIGAVFYNPANNASLFFPGGGVRQAGASYGTGAGALIYAGYGGAYFTSSMPTAANGYALTVYLRGGHTPSTLYLGSLNFDVNAEGDSRIWGHHIRCVAVPPPGRGSVDDLDAEPGF